MTIEISYTRRFSKRFSKYDKRFQEIIAARIEEFKNPVNHEPLRVHKLHGQMNGLWSFSVDYHTRVVFIFLSKTEAALLTIGDHEVYD